MKRWAALALALLLVTATYPDYPKPAEAQHREAMLKTVEDALHSMGFLTEREKYLDKLYPGIKLPTGKEILDFHGGKEAVIKMLTDENEGWFREMLKHPDEKAKVERIVLRVLAKLDTAEQVNRRYDIIAKAIEYKVEGSKVVARKLEFLLEVKSTHDFINEENIAQTIEEALTDSYLAAKGDPIVWVTDGVPKKVWAQRMLEYISKKGVGVSYSLSDQWMHANALEKVAQKVYMISIKPILERVGKAHLLEYKGILSFFEKNPVLTAALVLVGADVMVSLWEPADETQALVKMVLLDVIRTGQLATTAILTAKGLAFLTLSIALGSGTGVALAAVLLLPRIVAFGHAVITGKHPSPHVKVTKVTLDGVELVFAYVEPREVWIPRKVVVSHGDRVLLAVDVARYTAVMRCDSRTLWVGGKRLYVSCCHSRCSAIVTGYGSYNVREGRCTYRVAWSSASSVSLSLGDLSLGRAPQPSTSYWSDRYLLFCEPEPQRQEPRPVAVGGAPAQKPEEKYWLIDLRRWLSETWERAAQWASQLTSPLAARPELAALTALAAAAAIFIAVKRRRQRAV